MQYGFFHVFQQRAGVLVWTGLGEVGYEVFPRFALLYGPNSRRQERLQLVAYSHPEVEFRE